MGVLFLLLALTPPAFAEGITDAQRQALLARIEGYDAAMRTGDMKAVMGVMPPKMVERVAALASVSVDQLIEASQRQLDEAATKVTWESLEMDVDGTQFATLADGTVYGVLPTKMQIDLGVGKGKLKMTGRTFALHDGEGWYLIHTDEPKQLALLREIYPSLAGVEIPVGKPEMVTE